MLNQFSRTELLLGKEVEHIIINDIDRSIYSIWKLILSDNDELASFIQGVPLTIDEWRKQKEIVTHQTDYDDCELGLASFFMNRTNVSGIISGGTYRRYSPEQQIQNRCPLQQGRTT